jgi:lysophospholipase L1-like esterase
MDRRELTRLGLCGGLFALSPLSVDRAMAALTGPAFFSGPGNVPFHDPRVLAFGDSKIAGGFYASGNQTGYTNEGFLSWTNRLLGGLFRTIINKGVPGNDTTQMLSRYKTDVQANYDNYDVFWFDGGANDPRHGLPVESSLQNIQYFITDQIDNGKIVIWILPPPIGFANPIVSTGTRATVPAMQEQFQLLRAQLKTWLKTIPASWPVIAVDTYDVLVDPTTSTGDMYLGYAHDQIHPYTPGALLGARQIAHILADRFPRRNAPTHGPMDYYDATNKPRGNLIANPGFAMLTGGSGGFGGVVAQNNGPIPQYVTARKTSGSYTAAQMTFTNEIHSQGNRDTGNKWIINPTIAAGNTAYELLDIQISCLASAIPNLTAGQILRGGALIELVNPIGLGDIGVRLQHSGDVTYGVQDGWSSNKTNTPVFDRVMPAAHDTLYFETPPYTWQANGSSPSLMLSLRFQWNAVSQGASGQIKISQPWIEVVG